MTPMTPLVVVASGDAPSCRPPWDCGAASAGLPPSCSRPPAAGAAPGATLCTPPLACCPLASCPPVALRPPVVHLSPPFAAPSRVPGPRGFATSAGKFAQLGRRTLARMAARTVPAPAGGGPPVPQSRKSKLQLI